MNYELFIAKRIAFSKVKNTVTTRPIIRIALIGVILGFATMIITISIVSGFKREIREKVIGFGSHIQLSKYDENNSYETTPFIPGNSFLSQLRNDPEIKHIQVFATKPGILKSKNETEGIVAKGIGSDFDWTYFSSLITEGKPLKVIQGIRNDSILISRNLSKKLNLHAGENVIMHFIQQPPRARKFYISGIYETGLEEFDNLFLFCDISHIQKLNDWPSNQVGGVEISVKDFSKVEKVKDKVYELSASDLNARTILEIYPQIFDWLNLQDINAIIIITLMIIISVMNMVCALLIIILERINMIGIMKALGSRNRSIRRVFVYLASTMIIRGMIWGNIIGIAFIFIQKNFGIFHLDPKRYYLSYVPVDFSLINILEVNILSLFICILMMVLPTLIVTKISPVSAIRYS